MDCLLDDGMKKCHGPALWAYNNAVFTNDDFANIIKLGGATKEAETTKIGRFGLGFNAVYSLTDVPSFISRNYIAMFDPHTTHLGRAIRHTQKPGIKLDIQKNRRKLKRLSNQFKPFDGIFGCHLTTQEKNDYTYDGTLFRFPLRTPLQAETGSISKLCYNREKMIELIGKLLESAESLLLFTQNILKISVYHLNADAPDGSCADLLFGINRDVERILRPLTVTPALSEVASDEEKKVLKETNILTAASEEKLRSQYLTSPNSSICSVLIQRITVDTRPNVLSLLKCDGRKQSCSWVTSSCMGTKESFIKSLGDKSLLPVGGIAVPVQTDRDDIFPKTGLTGKVYCFLPLAIETNLRVHINGYFAVTSSRRYLCEKSSEDLGDTRGEWNDSLAVDPICTAYVNLLEKLTGICKPSRYDVAAILPCEIPKGDVPIKLRIELLRNLVIGDANVFTDGDKYASFYDIRFLSPTFRSSDIGNVALEILREFSSSVVVDMPQSLLDALQDAGCDDQINSRMYDLRRFFEEIFIPNITSLDVSKRNFLIFTSIIRTDEIDQLLRSHACIPIEPTGELRKPSELVSPTGRIAELFSEEDLRFPQLQLEDSRRKQVVAALERLGMKTHDIPWEDVLERAQSIANLSEEAARKRCKSLINYMEIKLKDNTDEYNRDIIGNLLISTRFLPVMRTPKSCPVPWKADRMVESLVAPKDAYLADKKKVLCFVDCLVENTIISKYQHSKVVTFMGLKHRGITTEQLTSQLFEIKKFVDKKWPERNEYICEIYKELETIYISDNSTSDSMRGAFVERGLLYMENEFRRFDRCALSRYLPKECLEYLCAPSASDFISFHNLYKAIGVKNDFEWTDYADALREMKADYGENPLERSHIQTALALLRCICRQIERDKIEVEDTSMKEDIYIPDDKGILQKCSEMCYINCQWLQSTDEMKLTHEDIPHSIAKKLGMKTAREDTLTRYSNALGMDFGQSEKLTNRLRRILTGYPKGITILKELLQNADDAGATEIHIILDPRQHKTQRVFKESWEPLQGPSLLVYNNKPFTEADMKGIQNLGEGSKEDDPTKTGQYGIGFNCVYHLTDAPMFITKGAEVGNTVCIFDPHCLYVPGASVASPGRRLDNLEELRKQFPDVFECFLEDEFCLEEATVFRFPLRTEEMAEISKIVKHTTSVEDVHRLLDEFITELPECLLFLNNMQKVTISRVDERSGNMHKIYQVNAELTEKNWTKRKLVSEKVQMAAKELKKESRNVFRVPCDAVLYDMKIEDSRGLCKEYRIGQQIGFDSTEEIVPTIVQGYQNRELGLLPRGGVAFLSAHSKLGKDRHSSLKEVISDNKLFCFLPLPLKVDLPKGVHINGHFALDYESRRTLWQREKVGLKADWNKEMMGKIVGPLYAKLLEDNAQKVDRIVAAKSRKKTGELDKHSRLFPSIGMKKQKHIYIDVLHDALYQSIHKNGLKVLPVTRPNRNYVEWYSTGEDVFFNNLSLFPSPMTLQKYTTFDSPVPAQNRNLASNQTVESTLLEADFNLLKLPLDVYLSFTEATVEVKEVNPEDVMKHFSTHRMKAELPKPLEDSPFKTMAGLESVIIYCKRDENFFNKLAGLPFLVTCDSELRVIDRPQGIYLSPYHTLISNKQDKFVHWDLISLFIPSPQKTDWPFRKLTVQVLEQMFAGDPECSFMGQNEEVEYLREKNFNAEWLHKLWEFLKEEADKVLEGSWYGPISDADRNRLDYLLQPLANWSVFPVTRKGKSSLLPLRRAAAAIDLHQGDFCSAKVREVMRKIKLPGPDYVVLYSDHTWLPESNPILLAKVLVASINNPAGVLICFQEQLAESALEALSCGEARSLLEYFADHLPIIRLVPGAIATLRKFPYYETVKNKLVSLEDANGFIIPHQLPTADMDCWEHTSGQVFLKSNASLKELYKYVGCIPYTEVEVYCSFILIQEHFQMMTEMGRSIHMTYIRDDLLPKLESMKEKTPARRALVEKLMALKFIPGPDKELLKASEFYDPTNQVFRVMHKENCFPPPKFREYRWHDFLKKIGMVHEITSDMFIDYALEVAVDATQNPGDKTTADQSKVLTEYLVDELPEERSEWRNMEFLRKISDVKFIATHSVEKCLRELHPQFGEREADGQLLYGRYRDSLICGTMIDQLTWSSSFLIPSWAELKGKQKDYLMQSLGVAKTPTFDVVLDHLVSLCQYQDHRKELAHSAKIPSSELLMSVLKQIYNFLKGCNSEYDAMKKKLLNVKFIPVENGAQLVHASRVVVDILPENEIGPYLYRLPLEVGEFAELFGNLGVSRKPIAEHYAQVLEEIHGEIGDEEMHPQNRFHALKAFICLVEKAEEPEKDLANCSHLYLPSGNKRLLPSSQLIFSDDSQLEKRLSKFKRPFVFDSHSVLNETIGFQVNCEKLMKPNLLKFFRGLPDRLKCIHLQDIIEEVMEDQATIESNHQADMVEEIKIKLRDPRFAVALLRLLRHQQIVTGNKNDEIDLVEQENQVKVEISNGLGRLKILTVENEITTYIQCEGKKVEGSEKTHEMLYRKQKGEDGNTEWILYIANKRNKFKETFWTRLSKLIDQLTGSRLKKDSFLLLPALLKYRLDEMSAFLDDEDIKPLLQRDNISWLPTPGEPIPLTDHHLLLQEFFDFEDLEFVGKNILLFRTCRKI